MGWSEATIIRAISRQVLQRRCILLVDNCQWTGHECDVLGVTQDLRIIDIEVKISRADLKADAKKDKWWNRYERVTAPAGYQYHQRREEPVARQWPPKVWKHYYAMPAEIWQDALFAALPSPRSGVILLSERHGQLRVHVERRAQPNRDAEQITPAAAIDIARLANLRMWDAYATR